MLLYFIQGITFGTAAALQPGPFQTFLISQTLANGRRRTLPAVFAPLLSDGPVIALVLLVLSRVPEGVVELLRLAGGAFIIYLAFGAFKAWRSFKTPEPGNHSGPKSLLQAVIVNLLNPNPYLFWSLVGGPLLIAGWRFNPWNSIMLMAGFYLTIIGTMAAGVLLLGTTGRLGMKIQKMLLGISALALVGFGLYQLWLGLKNLLWLAWLRSILVSMDSNYFERRWVMNNLIVFLLVGLVAGWLAGLIMKSKYGLIGDLIVGVVGAFLGGWLLGLLGITLGGGILGAFLTALIGALVLLFIVRLIFRRR
jgi:threonine/homoserine/homoserine lactone efflux protein/uncharacterized membrane protein YeaQ/YmgE (transglycosylase-associated protein family)